MSFDKDGNDKGMKMKIYTSYNWEQGMQKEDHG